jgi:hypothetical protein
MRSKAPRQYFETDGVSIPTKKYGKKNKRLPDPGVQCQGRTYQSRLRIYPEIYIFGGEGKSLAGFANGEAHAFAGSLRLEDEASSVQPIHPGACVPK